VNSRWFASASERTTGTRHARTAPRQGCWHASPSGIGGWAGAPPARGVMVRGIRWCARLRSRTTGYSPAHLRCAPDQRSTENEPGVDTTL